MVGSEEIKIELMAEEIEEKLTQKKDSYVLAK